MNETLKLILQQNPGLLTVLMTSVILPIAILALTNRHNRKLKEIEKNLDLKFKTKDHIREQEKRFMHLYQKSFLTFNNYMFHYQEPV